MARTAIQQYASSITCSCGKQAKFKAMVSIYPLGVVPRFTRTATPIPVCESCLKTTAKTVTVKTRERLASAFAEANGRALETLSANQSLAPTSKN